MRNRTARQRVKMPIETTPPKEIAARLPGIRTFAMGKCNILVAEEPMGFSTSLIQIQNPPTRWHLSISHPGRYPTWDEISKARESILPDALTFAIMLPAIWDEYVNIHPNCFHLWEVHDRDG